MTFDQLAADTSLNKTIESLKQKGYEVHSVEDKEKALEEIIKIIPKDSSVMNGSSVTLEQIGFQNYLEKGDHGWINLHKKITDQPDAEKRSKLRRESVLSDYYLGSVHALIEDGDYLVASNTGSQLPHVVFTSPNVIFVVSTKKIVKDLSAAFKRLEEYVIPLEDDHMQGLYGMNTTLNKIVISKGESPMIGRKIHFILVKENLGF